MSVEIVRRRLVVRFTGSKDSIYTDKITNKIVALEKEINSEIEFINKPSAEGTIVVKMQNGDAYEFFNWRDPFKEKDKKPPANYTPPEIQYKKLNDAIIKEDSNSVSGDFNIIHFVLLVLFIGLVAFGFIFIINVIL